MHVCSAILTSFFFPLGRCLANRAKFCMDTAMLAKRLAVCTRLSKLKTVSKLFEPQLQKIAIFTYPGLYFLFALSLRANKK